MPYSTGEAVTVTFDCPTIPHVHLFDPASHART